MTLISLAASTQNSTGFVLTMARPQARDYISQTFHFDILVVQEIYKVHTFCPLVTSIYLSSPPNTMRTIKFILLRYHVYKQVTHTFMFKMTSLWNRFPRTSAQNTTCRHIRSVNVSHPCERQNSVFE